ncbi:MAG TPA: ATP synthase F1 subunit gamma [Polyangia bacterium]|jgi:F-type H+-transporting ATPase subunit gamma|nr:ATP synthase F1 subunit gamma [Polyangia bacterium]
MPSLKAVRTRIASVKSTQKITRAMKLVAAAKLRRAQDAIIAARPYAQALAEAVAEVAARAGDDAHPMLQQRDGRRLAVIILTSDRGLCGGFNANICRTTQRFVDERIKSKAADEIQLDVVGRKGRDYFRRRRLKIAHEFPGVAGETALDRARELALTVGGDFIEGRVDGVFLVYNEFKSAMSQRVVSERLLPITPAAMDGDLAQTDFLYEPGKKELLNQLLPLYVQSQIYRAFLESIASEFGARMTSMDNATTNASEIIDRLTLQYNRARQAAITKELMEIVGGAEALKG